MTTQNATPKRDDFPALRRISTRWADNDVSGHVNNVVYYSFFDTAVNGWLIDATGVDANCRRSAWWRRAPAGSWPR